MTKCTLRLVVVAGALLFALAAVGCSDDSGGGNGVDAAVGPDAAIDAAPPTGTFTLLVTYWTGDASGDLVEGARVAFDKPGGDRVELSTAADGLASFDEIDWSLGNASVTVYKEDYVLASMVGFDEADLQDLYGAGQPWVGLSPNDPYADTVEATGMAVNLKDQANSFLLVSGLDVKELSNEFETGEWILHVPPNQPFTLIGLEWKNLLRPSMRGSASESLSWLTVPHPGLAVDTTGIQLDFATSTDATYTASGSIVLPTDPNSLLRASTFSSIRVTTVGSNWYAWLGGTTFIDISADENSFEYDLEWIEPADATDVITSYYVWGPAYRFGAWAVEEGYPTAGAHDFNLMEPPTLVTPSGSRVDHPLHSPMEWTLPDTDLRVGLYLYLGDQRVWNVHLFKDKTTCTVPRPPSTVDVAAVLGTGRLEGTLNVGRYNASKEYLERGSRVAEIYLLLEP